MWPSGPRADCDFGIGSVLLCASARVCLWDATDGDVSDSWMMMLLEIGVKRYHG